MARANHTIPPAAVTETFPLLGHGHIGMSHAEGVVHQSPGSRSAPWVPRAIHHAPPNPNGVPLSGRTGSHGEPHATGVAHQSPGSRSAPWERSAEPQRGSTIRPHRFACGETRHDARGTPLGFIARSGFDTQGALSDPGLRCLTPVGSTILIVALVSRAAARIVLGRAGRWRSIQPLRPNPGRPIGKGQGP